MISHFKVERFKNIANMSLSLEAINIVIGANNSGKSSLLQAIQFGVSVAQTTSAQSYWASGKLTTSVSPSQLIYTPINDVYALGHGYLREGLGREIKLTYTDDSTHSVIVSVKKGRNKNVLLELQGEPLGKTLQDLANPYSVFTPGLAGIPLEERYASPAVLRKAIARGDANLFLRNILHELSKNADSWSAFLGDIRSIFPNVNLRVDFDIATDETISVKLILDNQNELPIESCGTGLLQAIQILSYVNLFKPKLLIPG